MSILSERPDGFNFYYGFMQGDHRQINVRYEGGWWRAYVGGELMPEKYGYKAAAEAGAIEWAKATNIEDEAVE
jgi:hypothetical protein